MFKITFITCILIGLSLSKFLQTPRDNILSEEIFAISTQCNVPALGNNVAEFQIMKSNHTFVSFDIEKNFELLGIPNDDEVNPQKIKVFSVVVNHSTKKRAKFWIDSSNKTHTEPQPSRFGIENFLVPCIMWVEKFLPITENYKKSQEAEMEETEKEMGDIKYSYLDENSKITLNYFLKESNLTYMTQIYPNSPSYSRTLKMEIKDAKVMKESELEKIPEGLEWEELDD